MQKRTAALAALLLAGCATVDPGNDFAAVQELVAGRHPGEAAWLRDEEARAAAEERVRELLAAPLEPDAAAEIALLRNPSLQAVLEGLGIARADLAAASRFANPGISFASLSGGGARQRTLAVTGDLVDWLVRPLRRKVAEAELERVRLEAGQALLDAVAAARVALVRYQAAVQLAARLERIEEIDRAAADYARALFAAGNLTAVEGANAEAGWAETRAEVGRARAETARRREAVILALGLDGDEPWGAAPAVPAAAEEISHPTALEETALVRRLDLAAARWAVDALGRALALKRGTRYLPVGVELGVETEREIEGVRLTGPVIELRLPLFDTGKAPVARLEAELARARWQLAALEARARSEVRSAAADLSAARELAALYAEDLLPLRRRVLEGTLLEYNQMLVGTFDVLAAKQRVIDAERRAAEALSGYWEAWFELEAAVGGPLVPDPDDSPAASGGGGEEPR